MSRLWKNGQSITVGLNDDQHPESFSWRGHQHRVVSINNHWRIKKGWWFKQIWRDYYKLTTHERKLVTIYHDLVDGQWYMHRFYD